MTSHLYEVHFSKGKSDYVENDGTYHKYKKCILKSESELNTTKVFLKLLLLFLCSAVVYLGRNSTKDPALKRLCMGKFQIYGASYSSGMSNKVKQAIVQRCTCFKGLIYLELKE